MYRRVLAFDFDGTLAEHGAIAPDLIATLAQLHARGHALFLVTGRQVGTVDLGALSPLLTGIVWENGAVLQHMAADELFVPFGILDPGLIAALRAADVPLEHGQAIVATWAPYAAVVWRVLNTWGGDAVLVANKGALMILPPGAAKGTGLDRLLHICGFSARSVVAFGDGENDLSLFELGDCGVAVADAVPALRTSADVVTAQPGPAGVLAALQTYWLDPHPVRLPSSQHRQIPLGVTATDEPVAIPSALLLGSNLGIFGDSGSGKSWVAGLLAEGLIHAGYQVLLIDPEGDFRGLRGLPTVVTLECTPQALPLPSLVVALLEFGSASVVLDLCGIPNAQRIGYLAELLQALRPLREQRFRPHWIVLEEAQQFTHHDNTDLLEALAPVLTYGWAFVSYRPDWIAPAVRDTLTWHVLTHLTQPAAVAAVRGALGSTLSESPAAIPHGSVWLCDQQVIRLRPNHRRVPHVRHFYKYLHTPLPAPKRFVFWTAAGPTGHRSASLGDFLRDLGQVPLASLRYHQERGDFAAWIAGTIGDVELAAQLRKVNRLDLTDTQLRTVLVQRVTSRYQQLQTRQT